MKALGFWNFFLNSSLNIPQAVNHSNAVLNGRYMPYPSEARKPKKNQVIMDFRPAFMTIL